MSLSLLDNILLRTVVDPVLTAKGSTLTWEEEDTNFIIIHDAIKELSEVEIGGLDPFDAGTEYSNVAPDYVTYDGNTWEYVNAIPSTGVTPGTDPATWSLASSGVFIHSQNTDQYLDLGGDNESTALEVRTVIDNAVRVTGNQTIAGIKTFSSDIIIPDEAYGAGWNGSLEAPTKNAVYDKIESLSGGGDFVGPASSTDNAIVRFDGTTGKLGQNSIVTIDDLGNIGNIGNEINFGAVGNYTQTYVWFDSTNIYLGSNNDNGQVGAGSSSAWMIADTDSVFLISGQLRVNANNASNFYAGLESNLLTASRTFQFPDKAITFAGINDETFTGTTNFGNTITLLDTTQKTALDVPGAFNIRLGQGFSSLQIAPVNITLTGGTTNFFTNSGAIVFQPIGGGNPNVGVRIRRSSTMSAVSGTDNLLVLDNATYAPTSGTGIFLSIDNKPTINQTGTASGDITIYNANPTMTSVMGDIYGYRSQLADAPTGGGTSWNIYADGTAKNYFAGNTGVGITAATTSILSLGASTTAKSSLNIPSGTAPTSPVNGDIWSDGSDILVRLGGVTYTLNKT